MSGAKSFHDSESLAVRVAGRVLWFLLVGWWLGLLWFAAGVVLMMLAIWYPLGLFMACNTWALATYKEPPRRVVQNVKRVR